jgi:hypothetical protein
VIGDRWGVSTRARSCAPTHAMPSSPHPLGGRIVSVDPGRQLTAHWGRLHVLCPGAPGAGRGAPAAQARGANQPRGLITSRRSLTTNEEASRKNVYGAFKATASRTDRSNAGPDGHN